MKKCLLIVLLIFSAFSFSRLDYGTIHHRTAADRAYSVPYYIYGLKEYPISVCVKNDYLRGVFVEAISVFHESWHRWVISRSSPGIQDYQHKIPPIMVFKMACYKNPLGGPIVRVIYDEIDKYEGFMSYIFDDWGNTKYIKIAIDDEKTKNYTYDEIVLTALHELVHALGVPHNNTPGSLMYYRNFSPNNLYDYHIDDQTFFDFVKPYFVLGGDE